jgi:Tol biopolymer transport system component
MKLRFAAAAGVVMASTGWAQATQRVSIATDGREGNGDSFQPSISADGRYVAFFSFVSTFVPGDSNGWGDVFVRDRQLGTTERASVSSAGVQGDSLSLLPSISADGRYVAFESFASNLILGGTGGFWNIFVRDRQLGTTELVSLDSSGAQVNGGSYKPSISADGRYVAFYSDASNLVPGDTNGWDDIFVRDRQLGTTERVSVDSGGAQANHFCDSPSISADGRYVAFRTDANNLVPGDTNGIPDIFVRDRQLGTTERVSLDSSGVQGNGSSFYPSISGSGRYVAFFSDASNLVPGDTNGLDDIFVRDRQLGTTELVSVDSGGAQGQYGSYSPSISTDGRYVAFTSDAPNLVPGDTNASSDIFVRDRQLGTTERVSVASGGAQGQYGSDVASISADGRYVGFESLATNLVLGDNNASRDIFVRDRLGGTEFSSMCDPGAGGVIACPCSNPPNGAGRGCDNSAATGGAILAASGGTYLSSDSLVFTTSGEVQTATSILLQGTTPLQAGVIYGQGVRCVGGTLKRLFSKTAVAGAITAPNFGTGDPQVSARSAALGDMIQPGQSRWYLVYYRDLIVLGGCSASSTFNATQTGQVSWWP